MDKFAHIRPYSDGEVAAVIAELLDNSEFQSMMARLHSPRLSRLLPSFMRRIVARRLHEQLHHVHDVRSLQEVMKGYIETMIESRMDGLTTSGLDRLTPGQPYLFFSNHRDIALDPAFVNYAIYHAGHDTLRIAIGDNLLTKPFASDLMRLNKSFIVPRSARGPRQMLAAFKTLSEYIHHSLTVDRVPVWLAHREGRAKDGVDRTEPAILKMLAMSRDKNTVSLAEHIRSLNIVPVSISYEWDPCDLLKARELLARAQGEVYEKAAHEDLASIGTGINGEKGHVHISFGAPLTGNFDTVADIAAAVDHQIAASYVLHPSNVLAYRELSGDTGQSLPVGYPSRDFTHDAAKAAKFEKRFSGLDPALREMVLNIYANPVRSWLNSRSDAGI